MTSQARSICFLLHSTGAMPGTKLGIQGEQAPLT